MRVIFLQDVERVGHEGEIGDVADGYARNYLIPRGLAVKASKGAMLELEQRRSAIEKRQAEKESKAESLAGIAYRNIVARILGEDVPLMELKKEPAGFFSSLKKLFGRK